MFHVKHRSPASGASRYRDHVAHRTPGSIDRSAPARSPTIRDSLHRVRDAYRVPDHPPTVRSTAPAHADATKSDSLSACPSCTSSSAATDRCTSAARGTSIAVCRSTMRARAPSTPGTTPGAAPLLGVLQPDRERLPAREAGAAVGQGEAPCAGEGPARSARAAQQEAEAALKRVETSDSGLDTRRDGAVRPPKRPRQRDNQRTVARTTRVGSVRRSSPTTSRRTLLTRYLRSALSAALDLERGVRALQEDQLAAIAHQRGGQGHQSAQRAHRTSGCGIQHRPAAPVLGARAQDLDVVQARAPPPVRKARRRGAPWARSGSTPRRAARSRAPDPEGRRPSPRRRRARRTGVRSRRCSECDATTGAVARGGR